MSQPSVAEAVLTFVIDECGAPPEIGLSDPLFSSQALDSLDIIRLISFIEDRFGVRVPALEVSFERFDTAAQIADVVAEHGPS